MDSCKPAWIRPNLTRSRNRDVYTGKTTLYALPHFFKSFFRPCSTTNWTKFLVFTRTKTGEAINFNPSIWARTRSPQISYVQPYFPTYKQLDELPVMPERRLKDPIDCSFQWRRRRGSDTTVRSLCLSSVYTVFTRWNASDGSKITNYYGNLHHLGNKSYNYCC